MGYPELIISYKICTFHGKFIYILCIVAFYLPNFIIFTVKFENFQVLYNIIQKSLCCSTEIIFSFLCRTLITTALGIYVKCKKKCNSTPVQCLDGIGSSGVMGLLWKKYIQDDIDVTINDACPQAYERIKENMKINNLEVDVLNRDTCALLHEKTYNFM